VIIELLCALDLAELAVAPRVQTLADKRQEANTTRLEHVPSAHDSLQILGPLFSEIVAVRADGHVDDVSGIADFPGADVPVGAGEKRLRLARACAHLCLRSRHLLVRERPARKLAAADERQRAAEEVEL